MTVAFDNTKFLALNARITDEGLIFAQPLSQNPSDPNFLCRPSSQGPPFSMITDPQAISRAFNTDSDRPRSTYRHNRPGSRNVSRASNRPESAVVKSFNNDSWVRLSEDEKKELEVANIRSVTKVSLERFHQNLIKVKKQDEIIKNKMEKMQSSWEGMMQNSRILNYKGSQMVDKVLERKSTRSRLAESQIDLDGNQLTKSINFETNPDNQSVIKVKPLIASRKDYAAFFQEPTMHRSLKKSDSLKLEKEGTLASSFKDRMRYNSFVQAYQGPTADIIATSERSDIQKSNRKIEESSLREKHEKETGTTEERENSVDNKDKKVVCSIAGGDTGLFVSPRPNSALDNSLHDEVEGSPGTKKSKTQGDLASFPLKPVGFMKLEGMNLLSKIPAMHHRPLSARKKVKATSIAKIIPTINRETTDTATHDLSLQSKKILTDPPIEPFRPMSSNRNYSNRQEVSHTKERPSVNNNDKSMLTIQGTKCLNGAFGVRFRPRTASTGRFRSLNSSESKLRNTNEMSLAGKGYSNSGKKPSVVDCIYSVKSRDIRSAGMPGIEHKEGNKSVIESWVSRSGHGKQNQGIKDRVMISVPFKEFTF